jgi:hypothetical protein
MCFFPRLFICFASRKEFYRLLVVVLPQRAIRLGMA